MDKKPVNPDFHPLSSLSEAEIKIIFAIRCNEALICKHPDYKTMPMQAKQKQFLILLIAGFVLSSLLQVTFTLSEGFTFHEIEITLPLPLFDFAGQSNQTHLTSTLVGYVLYAAAGLVFIGQLKVNQRWLFITLGFILVTLYAIYFEASAWASDINDEYTGKHMSIGPVLFLLGLLIYAKQKIISGR